MVGPFRRDSMQFNANRTIVLGRGYIGRPSIRREPFVTELQVNQLLSLLIQIKRKLKRRRKQKRNG